MTKNIGITPNDDEIDNLQALLDEWGCLDPGEKARPHTIQRYQNKKGQNRLTIICSITPGDDDDA